MHAGRDANAARLRQALQAGRDVYPVTEDVTVLDDNVALMDADPQFDAAGRRNVLVVFRDLRLDLASAAKGVDCAGEFGEDAIASGLDYPAVVDGMFGSIDSRRRAFRRDSVPVSSCPIRRL